MEILDDSIQKASLISVEPSKKQLRSFKIADRNIDILVFKDNHPELTPIFKLWYEVYVEELNYPKTQLVDEQNKMLRCIPNGSYIFAAFLAGDCIGTIRTTHENADKLEFRYSDFLTDRPNIEATKLIIKRNYRKTALKAVLMREAHTYHLKRYKSYYICINSSERLLAFYRAMGFFFVSREPFIHPQIQNTSYLLACKSEVFTKICIELEKLLDGSAILKYKWALKYFWFNHS